jgi:hypothetical protein
MTGAQFEELRERLYRIEAGLASLRRLLFYQGAHMSKELDALSAEVSATRTVEDSAILLLNGLSAQIASLKGDPAALQTLADSLHSKAGELAAAVSANTPAA